MFGQSVALFCLQLLLFDFWSKTLKPNSLLSLSKETVLVQVGDSLLNMVKAVINTINFKEINTEKTKNLFDLKIKSPAGSTIIAVVRSNKTESADLNREAGSKDTSKHYDSTLEQQLVDQHLDTFITKSEIELYDLFQNWDLLGVFLNLKIEQSRYGKLPQTDIICDLQTCYLDQFTCLVRMTLYCCTQCRHHASMMLMSQVMRLRKAQLVAATVSHWTSSPIFDM